MTKTALYVNIWPTYGTELITTMQAVVSELKILHAEQNNNNNSAAMLYSSI